MKKVKVNLHCPPEKKKEWQENAKKNNKSLSLYLYDLIQKTEKNEFRLKQYKIIVLEQKINYIESSIDQIKCSSEEKDELKKYLDELKINIKELI